MKIPYEQLNSSQRPEHSIHHGTTRVSSDAERPWIRSCWNWILYWLSAGRNSC